MPEATPIQGHFASFAVELMRLSASAAEEATRTTSEMQRTMFAAWRDAQRAALGWMIDVSRRNTEATMRTLERVQSQAEETTHLRAA